MPIENTRVAFRSCGGLGRRLRTLGVLTAALLGAASAAAQTLDEAIDLHLAGELERALAAYRVVASEEAESDPVGAAIAYNNACLILINTSRFTEALADCEQGGQLLTDPDLDDLRAENINNRALALQNLGRLAEAAALFREAAEINERLELDSARVLNLANLGALETARAAYGSALTYFGDAERLSRAHADEPWAIEQSSILRVNRAVVLEKLGEPREALALLREVVEEHALGDPRYAATLRVNLAFMYRDLGDPVTALTELDAAARVFERVGDRVGLSNAWLTIAFVQFHNLGDAEAAERSLERALELAREAGSVQEEVSDLLLLGEVQRDRVPAESLAAFERAHELAESAGLVESAWTALDGIAQARLAAGDIADAITTIDRAVDLLEDTRSGLDRAAFRGSFLVDQRGVFGTAIEARWALYVSGASNADSAVAQAFELAQRAKAIDLQEVLRGPAAPPLTLAEAQAHLGNAMALEYFVTPDSGYVWSVRDSAAGWHRLEAVEDLGRAVREAHARYAAGEHPQATTLARVSELLRISMINAESDLIVAADGPLGYLPFSELPLADGRLGEAVTLRYVPSLSFLSPALAPPGGESPSDRFLGFANPNTASSTIDSSGGPVPEAMALLQRRWNLPPLPAAEAELVRAADALGGGDAELFFGSRATEPAFRAAVEPGASVLHIAAHAVVEERTAAGPAIVLAPEDGSDGLLYASEVAALRFPVRLTILAACRTALGDGSAGRAMTSLTGAFLAAGSEAVIATLWDVGDANAAAFLNQYYSELRAGRPAADALATVQARFRDDPRWADDSSWAAFVLVGGSPRLRAPWWWAAAGLTAVALLIIAAAWVSRRRSRP